MDEHELSALENRIDHKVEARFMELKGDVSSMLGAHAKIIDKRMSSLETELKEMISSGEQRISEQIAWFQQQTHRLAESNQREIARIKEHLSELRRRNGANP